MDLRPQMNFKTNKNNHNLNQISGRGFALFQGEWARPCPQPPRPLHGDFGAPKQSREQTSGKAATFEADVVTALSPRDHGRPNTVFNYSRKRGKVLLSDVPLPNSPLFTHNLPSQLSLLP